MPASGGWALPIRRMFLIPLIAAIALVVCYVVVTDASAPSKALLAALLVVSLACTFGFPRLRLAGLLIQVALGVFVLLYLKVRAP